MPYAPKAFIIQAEHICLKRLPLPPVLIQHQAFFFLTTGGHTINCYCLRHTTFCQTPFNKGSTPGISFIKPHRSQIHFNSSTIIITRFFPYTNLTFIGSYNGATLAADSNLRKTSNAAEKKKTNQPETNNNFCHAFRFLKSSKE